MRRRLATAAALSLALALGAPAVVGAAAPRATTGPTTAVGATTATVTGTVEPGGEPTTWVVEHGTTTDYGQRTSSRSAGDGTAPVDVSVQLTGLETGVTIHYRVVATNGDGTARGEDRTLRTGAAPAVTIRSPSQIGPTRALVAGTVDPNGLATTWYAEYGTSRSYGSRSAPTDAGSGTSARTVSVDLSGLRSGTTYYTRLVATNAAGTTRSGERSFRTDPGPRVSTGAARDVGRSSARVSGSVDPEGRYTVAWFEYGSSTAYGSRTPERGAGYGTRSTTFTETLTGLPAGTTIHYRIVARSDAGTSAGRDRTFRTTDGPAVVTGPVTELGPDAATATGAVDPRGRSTSWWFEFGTTTRYGSRTPLAPAGSGSGSVPVTARLSALPAATELHVRLVAESSAGRTYGGDVAFRTSGAPVAVTGPVTRLGITRATVGGSVDPRGAATSWWVELGRTPALGRRLAGGTVSGASPVAVARSLTGLAPGVRWFFRIVAENSAGRSEGRTASFATAPRQRDATGRLVRCTIVGTAVPDVLRGTPRRDVICGLGGNDRIVGLGGDDLLMGGPGWDVLDGGGGRDTILGGAGADLIRARDGRRDVVDGGAGPDAAVLDRVDRRRSVERVRR